MQHPQDAIAASLTMSLTLMKQYCADLSPAEYLHRPAPKANCTAWLLGHLILSERRALALLNVTDLPQLADGFDKRFGRTDDAPGAAEFGDVTNLLALWEQHRTMLIDAVKRATLDTINKPLEKPQPIFATVGEMVNFMAQHATMHAGQITIIRRSLGRPPVV